MWMVFPGDLAVVISCASLALADAGIVMYDLVPAISAVGIFEGLQEPLKAGLSLRLQYISFLNIHSKITQIRCE